MLVDIGVNLTNSQFDGDRDAVVERALAHELRHKSAAHPSLQTSPDQAAPTAKPHHPRRLMCEAICEIFTTLVTLVLTTVASAFITLALGRLLIFSLPLITGFLFPTTPSMRSRSLFEMHQ